MKYAFLFAAAISLLLAACAEHREAGIAIRDVTVIDASKGLRRGQTVVFDGDSITYAGPNADAPETDESVDGQGRYLIPGLWDFHVHLTYDDRFTPIMPASFLRYGVTSIRDTGGLLAKLLPVVNAMRADDKPAPRVFFSGPLLDGEHVVYDGVTAPEIGLRNSTPDQAEHNVSTLKEAGASFIKIYEMVSPEVFEALVSAARTHELPIAAHVPLAMTATEAGPLVGTMEHLRNVELDCAANWQELQETRRDLLRNDDQKSGLALRSSLHRLQRRPAIDNLDEQRCDDVISALANTIQVPTAALNTLTLNPMFEREDWPAALAEMPDAVRDEWATPPRWLPADIAERDTTFARYTMHMIQRMNSVGVPIAAGTDTPIAHAIPGYSLHNELEILVNSGLTTLEALEAATVTPARFFSLQDSMGSIDVGKQADLVLLDANPLEDINNIRRIAVVVSKGEVVVDDQGLASADL